MRIRLKERGGGNRMKSNTKGISKKETVRKLKISNREEKREGTKEIIELAKTDGRPNI